MRLPNVLYGEIPPEIRRGSGLGLAIAKSFTELQGGRLEVFTDADLFTVEITFLKNY